MEHLGFRCDGQSVAPSEGVAEVHVLAVAVSLEPAVERGVADEGEAVAHGTAGQPLWIRGLVTLVVADGAATRWEDDARLPGVQEEEALGPDMARTCLPEHDAPDP